MSVKPLNQPKPIRLLLFRALFKRAKNTILQSGELPELPKIEHQELYANLQAAHIEKFHQVVNWPSDSINQIHPCYFYLLAFPQHLKLMLDVDFPFSMLGTIHLRNRIEQFAAIDINGPLEVSSRFGEIKRHEKGIMFSIKSSIKSANAEIWRSEGWFLVKQKSKEKPNKAKPEDINLQYKGSSSWYFSAKTGRRYAKVSGDYNPIHLYRFSAKLFGFKCAIAHGMWSKSWCVSAMSEYVQPKMIVDVKFDKPLLLPSKVTFHRDKKSDQQIFALSSKDGKYIHIKGQLDY